MQASGNKVTMSDIAEKVGVTQATVSHVLNGTAKISESVSKKVLKAAKEMGYKKKPKVQGVSKSKSVGLLIPDVENSFYAETAKVVEIVLRRHGYLTFQCNTLYRAEYERMYVKALLEYGVMGIVVGYPMTNGVSLELLRASEIPAVFLDGAPQDLKGLCPTIEINNTLGGELAANHLFKLGAKNVCIASEPLVNQPLEERVAGFKTTMAANGVPVDEARIFIETSQYSKMDMGCNIGAKILIDGGIDAVFATSDYVALGIIKRLKESKKRIPEEIMVMGYDDISIAQIIEPPLTTIAQPVGQMAKTGAEMLCASIKGQQEAKSITMDPCLIIRESTMK